MSSIPQLDVSASYSDVPDQSEQENSHIALQAIDALANLGVSNLVIWSPNRYTCAENGCEQELPGWRICNSCENPMLQENPLRYYHEDYQQSVIRAYCFDHWPAHRALHEQAGDINAQEEIFGSHWELVNSGPSGG